MADYYPGLTPPEPLTVSRLIGPMWKNRESRLVVGIIASVLSGFALVGATPVEGVIVVAATIVVLLGQVAGLLVERARYRAMFEDRDSDVRRYDRIYVGLGLALWVAAVVGGLAVLVWLGNALFGGVC